MCVNILFHRFCYILEERERTNLILNFVSSSVFRPSNCNFTGDDWAKRFRMLLIPVSLFWNWGDGNWLLLISVFSRFPVHSSSCTTRFLPQVLSLLIFCFVFMEVLTLTSLPLASFEQGTSFGFLSLTCSSFCALSLFWSNCFVFSFSRSICVSLGNSVLSSSPVFSQSLFWLHSFVFSFARSNCVSLGNSGLSSLPIASSHSLFYCFW